MSWCFNKIRSKTIPNRDSGCPLSLALTSVTCPINLVSTGIMILPWDTTSCATSAFILSPTLSFLALSDLVNSTSMYESFGLTGAAAGVVAPLDTAGVGGRTVTDASTGFFKLTEDGVD